MNKFILDIRATINRINVCLDGAKFGNQVRFNKYCKMTKQTYIGNDCHFNGMKIIGHGKVIIGDHFHSGEECLLITQNHNYDNGTALPYDDTVILKETHIGKYVWLGSRVTILPGSVIEDGAIIQAGSVVCGRIERCGIAGGHPAKVFKYRNEEHYNKLARSVL